MKTNEHVCIGMYNECEQKIKAHKEELRNKKENWSLC